MRKIFLTQWADIKGNVKWDLLKWGITAVLASLGSIWKWPSNFGSIWYFIVIFSFSFIAASVLTWVIRRFIKPKTFLKIEGIQSDVPQGSKPACQIRIHNEHKSRSAVKIKVELLELEEMPERKEHLAGSLPRILEPENHANDHVNPGAKNGVFNLFYALKTPGSRNGKDHLTILAYMKNDSSMAGNIRMFESNTDYRIKIQATANDFPKTEQEFTLRFNESGSKCLFSLVENISQKSDSGT